MSKDELSKRLADIGKFYGFDKYAVSLPPGIPIDNLKLNASGNWESPYKREIFGDWGATTPQSSESDNPCAHGCDWKVYDSGFTRFEYCARPGCKKERPI